MDAFDHFAAFRFTLTGLLTRDFFNFFLYSVLNIHAIPQLSIAGLPDMPDMGITFGIFRCGTVKVKVKVNWVDKLTGGPYWQRLVYYIFSSFPYSINMCIHYNRYKHIYTAS